GAPSLEARGTRTNLDVTVGIADFGKQGCGTTVTTTKDIVVTNYASAVVGVTASLGSPSAFAFVNPPTINLPAGSATTPTTGVITLKLNPLGNDLTVIQENVNLSIVGVPAPSGGPRMTQARVDVRGAIIDIDPTSLIFAGAGTK